MRFSQKLDAAVSRCSASEEKEAAAQQAVTSLQQELDNANTKVSYHYTFAIESVSNKWNFIGQRSPGAAGRCSKGREDSPSRGLKLQGTDDRTRNPAINWCICYIPASS